MAKILFFNPPSRQHIYLSTNTRVGAPSYPSLTLATLAGHMREGHQVQIVDLDLCQDMCAAIVEAVERFKPDLVASTANTPAFPAVRTIMRLIKERYPSIRTIVGGVHITALPEEALAERSLDVIATGEGDETIPELLAVSDPRTVCGIAYRDATSGETVVTAKRKLIHDLNALPYPAWHLFRLDRYKNSRLSSRRNPVGLIETSRGCAFRCIFCNKMTFGSVYRTKEPRRVVDEMEYMLTCGFKEIHIIDDSFTQDIARAKEVCVEMMRRRLKVPWSLINGIRVDKVDEEFFRLAKKAGCWQVGFGLETGDQDVLRKIDKGITLAQSEHAVRLAHRAGIDTFGFFILALAGETEASLQRTIAFARKLPLDTAKFDICIPYPGTPYCRELKAAGRIISEDWAKYNCHQIEEPLFTHANLAWPMIMAYYKRAFREFYLRPAYIARRFVRSLRRGDLLYDLTYFLRSRW